MAMTTVKFQKSFGISGDLDDVVGTGKADATDTPHLPRFMTGEYVYRFSDYTNAVSVIQKPYLVNTMSEVTDTDAFLDLNGLEAFPNDGVNPYVKTTRAFESKVAWFYDIVSHRNGTTTDHVHQSDLATLAEIKTYIGTSAVGTWVDPT